MDQIWNKAKELIKGQVSEQGYRSWIEPLEVLEAKENEVVLTCPTNLSQRWFHDQYREVLEKTVTSLAEKPIKLSVIVTPAEREPQTHREPREKQIPLPNLDVRTIGGRLLRKDFTFDRFVVGECNKFAHFAARSLASTRKRYQNCLFLVSKTGLGKSHLSQAVGHRILELSPKDRVCYITVEDFMNEMVSSIQDNTLGRFKEKYRKNCDVLLLEDVHFLSGKKRTQSELAYTLDFLMECDRRLIFTSIYAPNEIPKLEDSLSSRLSNSIVSEIEPPDFKTRVRILKKKARGVNVPREILEFLASELTENVRQLESGLNGILVKSSILDMLIDLPLAQEVVKNITRKKEAITLGVIKEVVCKYYRVAPKELIGKSRKQEIVRPRQVAMYLGRKFTDQSLQAIGRSFNRYHATALHAINQVESHIRRRDEIQRQVAFLCEKIESGEF